MPVFFCSLTVVLDSPSISVPSLTTAAVSSPSSFRPVSPGSSSSSSWIDWDFLEDFLNVFPDPSSSAIEKQECSLCLLMQVGTRLVSNLRIVVIFILNKQLVLTTYWCYIQCTAARGPILPLSVFCYTCILPLTGFLLCRFQRRTNLKVNLCLKCQVMDALLKNTQCHHYMFSCEILGYIPAISQIIHFQSKIRQI